MEQGMKELNWRDDVDSAPSNQWVLALYIEPYSGFPKYFAARRVIDDECGTTKWYGDHHSSLSGNLLERAPDAFAMTDYEFHFPKL